MSLEDRILALPKRTPGQHDTVLKAATLAAEADELMREMAECLESANFDNNVDMREADALAQKYRKMEKTNERK